MELPATIENVMERLGLDISVETVINLLTGKTNFASATPDTKHVLHYSVPAVNHGRPTSEVLIVLAGQSGVGKSTTINGLFEDPNLCQVSDRQSGTNDVHLCTKKLTVTSVSPAIKAPLVLVDSPGFLDTDSSRNHPNLVKLLNFRNTYPGLKKRNIPSIVHAFASAKVYPNLVLLMFNVSEQRLEGPDSVLSKSLKILRDTNLVDVKHINLIAVGTHACMLPKKKGKYQEKINTITRILKNSVREFVGVRNVQVVFVENEPEDYGLEKPPGADFYELPDGSLSHCTLIEAIFNIFKASDDKLGLLLTSWYFQSSCPDKSALAATAVHQPVDEGLDMHVNQAAKLLEKHLHISPLEVVPIYEFQSLGYAYCPVTETSKSHFVLSSSELNTLQIRNSKYLMPSFLKCYTENKTEFRRLWYETQESYQAARKTQYGIDLGVNLNVSSGLNCGIGRRWGFESQTQVQDVQMSLVHDVKFALLRVDEPEQYISTGFTAILQSLPSVYRGNEEKYNEFFSKFGTHFISKLHFGGYIQIDCTIQKSCYNSNSISDLQIGLDAHFKALSAGFSFQRSSTAGKLQSVGISDMSITFGGGSPPQTLIRSLEDLTPAVYQNWIKSVQDNPTELTNFSLYPYYNLPQCTQCGELRIATEEFLEQKLARKIKNKRDEIGRQGQQDAQIPAGKDCFPPTTMVRLFDKSGHATSTKLISELKPGDRLITMKSCGKKSAPTTFLTSLHTETAKVAEFICFTFDNGRILKATREHLLMISQENSTQLQAVLAKLIQVGDAMAFMDDNGQISRRLVTNITIEKDVGVYCPLTTTGTFLAEGFLVTSYADVHSFQLADAAMAPLKLWYTMRRLWTKKGEQVNDDNEEGVHAYAMGLQRVRSMLK